MTEVSEQARQITCPGCGGSFRVAPRRGRRLPDSVPCPTCDSQIPVESGGGEKFWVSRSHADIFHRDVARRGPRERSNERESVSEQDPAAEEGRSEERSESRREKQAPPGRRPSERESSSERGTPQGRRPSRQVDREFRSVDEVRGKGGSVLARLQSGVEKRKAEADEAAREERELDDIADDAAQYIEESGLFDSAVEEVEREVGSGSTAGDTPTSPLPASLLVSESEAAETPEEGSDAARADAGDDALDAADRDDEAGHEDGRDAEGSEEAEQEDEAAAEDAGAAQDASAVAERAPDDAASSPATSAKEGDPTDAAAGRRDYGWLYSLLAVLGTIAAIGVVALDASFFKVGLVTERGAAAGDAGSAGGDGGTDTGADGEAAGRADGGADAGPGSTKKSGATAGGVEEAVARAKKQVDAATAPLAFARQLIEAERFGAARQRVRSLLARRPTRMGPQAGRARKLLMRAVDEDPSFERETVTLGVDETIHAIHALGGGWSISFRLTRGGDNIYAFKPTQKNWEEGWRAEIAAYHLCRVLACPFEIPRNRPARISKSRFQRLYRRVWDEDQEAYAERFEHLKWVTEKGPDGQEREYLYGTIKDWVPDFVRWPIEYEDVWTPWLDLDHPADVLAKPLEETLAPLKTRGDVDFYRRILDEKAGAQTRDLARQLSAILVFDFLVTNWDRFSTATKYYGVNNFFADGQFVSLDNGAAFPTIHFPIVHRRLAAVGRFSRQLIATVRALDPRVINPVLFPDPSAREKERLSVFWQQRDRLVDRIRRLRAEYPTEAIFEFR